jgi:hypothetical protein
MPRLLSLLRRSRILSRFLPAFQHFSLGSGGDLLMLEDTTGFILQESER